MAGSARKVIVPGDANGSRLVQMVSSGRMPPRGDKLTAEQIQFIVNWINAKAPNKLVHSRGPLGAGMASSGLKPRPPD